MAFRRPRVNVKPNVQTARPTTNIVRSSETSVESASNLPEKEQLIEQPDIPVKSPTIKEPITDVEESTTPLISEAISTTVPSPLPPPPLPPLPCQSSAPLPPTSTTPSTTIGPITFRRRVAPNISSKNAIHHRRPSASCSGTESESESSRQRHAIASTITLGRPAQAINKTITTNQSEISSVPEQTTIEDSSTTTKADEIVKETIEVPAVMPDDTPIQTPSRPNTKISREYLTQHIIYRAQRLAAKVEPDMTIRKRRAATLEKFDDTNIKNGQPIDTSKLKIADFVHYNPSDNRMETKAKSTTIITDNSDGNVRKQSFSATDGPSVNFAPQLKIDANGTVVVDEESLYIRNMEDTERNTVVVDGQFNDDNLTHRSYRKIGKRKRWNNRDTLRFYQALRMCGTDFTLIAGVFPNRDRNDIKRKFKTEDKANRSLIDSALSQRIPFDLTCFYSPSEASSSDEDENEIINGTRKKTRKRRSVKRGYAKKTSSDPLEINRRREKRLQSKKSNIRKKKSAEFIEDDDDEEEGDNDNSMDVADTVEVMTTAVESKTEQIIPSSQNEDNPVENSIENMNDLANLLGNIDGSHLLFVHNTDETTGLDRIDVHVVMSNASDNANEQSI